jgi:hypothetical protein
MDGIAVSMLKRKYNNKNAKNLQKSVLHVSMVCITICFRMTKVCVCVRSGVPPAANSASLGADAQWKAFELLRIFANSRFQNFRPNAVSLKVLRRRAAVSSKLSMHRIGYLETFDNARDAALFFLIWVWRASLTG